MSIGFWVEVQATNVVKADKRKKECEPQDDCLHSWDHWKRVMQGHAGANLVPLVASNCIGTEVIEAEHDKSAITTLL
ncbi:hypothetical protein L1987_52554 [Smallanthus sonchifolius]|uniref:Uncharacterized protein n=1 Tax=Smallanthus sonchifolius TaxID=185202 RepID=A0ACB9EUK9_9ASTR|nr:hypothetical protein L1987_52554 [Smallanthus sonchifolius]